VVGIRVGDRNGFADVLGATLGTVVGFTVEGAVVTVCSEGVALDVTVGSVIIGNKVGV
jgi:hypothetical protein